MQSCSSTIGARAGALAKAQPELTNPEKSVIATTRGSSCVRKDEASAMLPWLVDWTWSQVPDQHEIATIQTTAIDKEAGLIHLTTMIALIW